jgi:hypothetical protein
MTATKTYRGYTLEEAKAELELWKKAKRAAATGKSYAIGSRNLTRYDLAEINREIDRFADIVDALTTGRGGLIKVLARQPRW